MSRQWYLRDESFRAEIDLLCARFKHAVTPGQIVDWIEGNFRTNEDRRQALRVLHAVEYFHDDDILEAYDEGLKQLLKAVGPKSKTGKICLVPVGAFGKSGTAMAYFMKKTDTYRKKAARFNLISDLDGLTDEEIASIRVLVFIDDFFGSGGSVVKYYRDTIEPRLTKVRSNPKLFLISIVSMNQALQLFKEELPNAHVFTWVKRDKAFSYSGSPFGYRHNMVNVREFCFKYGAGLYVYRDPKTKCEIDNPLGHGNSQALVAFSYTTPNNTLPILWSNRNDWKPLFPRASNLRVSQLKEFRKETAHWISVAREMNFPGTELFMSGHGSNSWRDYHFITKTDFQLFAIIRLKRARRAVPLICQDLGLRTTDYEELINEGVKRKLFQPDGTLTNIGLKAYISISKAVQRKKRQSVPERRITRNNTYIPKMFRGKT